MVVGRVLLRRELLYFASGFCLALLILIAWRYVIPSQSSSPVSSPTAPEVAGIAKRPAQPSPSLQFGRPTQVSRPIAPERRDAPGDWRGDNQWRRQVNIPSQPDLGGGHEGSVEVRDTSAAEADHEALRAVIQNMLQQKIEEDQNLRAVLHEAGKTYLEQRKESEP